MLGVLDEQGHPLQQMGILQLPASPAASAAGASVRYCCCLHSIAGTARCPISQRCGQCCSTSTNSPEKQYHRKESELLFPKLRARTPQSRELLDQLHYEHGRGERSIRDLEHALLGFEMMGEARRLAFEEAAVSFYLGHMALEEEEILPLAQQVLSDADWAELDEAFKANRDPLTGHAPEAEYRALFTRIVNAVPAPTT